MFMQQDNVAGLKRRARVKDLQVREGSRLHGFSGSSGERSA